MLTFDESFDAVDVVQVTQHIFKDELAKGGSVPCDVPNVFFAEWSTPVSGQNGTADALTCFCVTDNQCIQPVLEKPHATCMDSQGAFESRQRCSRLPTVRCHVGLDRTGDQDGSDAPALPEHQA